MALDKETLNIELLLDSDYSQMLDILMDYHSFEGSKSEYIRDFLLRICETVADSIVDIAGDFSVPAHLLERARSDMGRWADASSA